MLLFIFLSACASDTTFHGTFVGNPGKGNAQVASSEGIALSQAKTALQNVYYSTHEDDYVRSYNSQIDLLNSSDSFPIYSGSWTHIGFDLAPGLDLMGSALEEQFFEWNLEELFIVIELNQTLAEEEQYLLEFGSANWIPAQTLSAIAQENIIINDYPELEAEIITKITEESHLYHDIDQNGIIDDNERTEIVGYAVTDDDLEAFDSNMLEYWDTLIEEDDD